MSFLTFAVAFGASVAASSSPSVVCVAGQCLQGFTNTTIGAKLTANGAPSAIQLLPGQYTSSTNPKFLHDLLTSPSASFTPSAGFQNATSSTSLPLNLALSPGLAIYPERLYSGLPGFAQLPSAPTVNSSTHLSASSLYMSSNVWAAIAASKTRFVLWDAVPDIAQLPLSSSDLSLQDMQSSTCSPPCSSSSVCSPSGTCTCPTGFTGSSCETCASGFFGPNCQPCPNGCAKCDEGMTGSGHCLVPVVSNPPAACNCLNGVCGSNGQCQCNPGWTASGNGTACAKCDSGFFLTSTGDCKTCQLGCNQCTDGTGSCTSCKSGFTQNSNDPTRCDPVQQSTNTGTVCPDGSFANGGQCGVCSPSCKTCNGPTSNDCIICASGSFSSKGNCLKADSNGVCEGTTLVADNNKHQCETCGAKCTSCRIPNFNAASTINQLECTACLPGSVLSDGKCLDSCPTGSFVSTQDNQTCLPCDSSCGTCIGAAKFCLTCSSSSQLASNGECVSTCPSGTFTPSGTGKSCLTCHPDCASCSGSSFNQCSSCPSFRPVLSNGRCLPTCSRAQYFDTGSGKCRSCDSSCGSCMGPGSSDCLSCSGSSQVLKSGVCVNTNCSGSPGASVIPGLGVCLSDLVSATPPTNVNSSPLPTITGLSNPTPWKQLQWWQVLLMALGCAFIFLVVVLCWRRKAKKQRKERTKKWAEGKRLTGDGWRAKFVRMLCGESHEEPRARDANVGASVDVERGDSKKLTRVKKQETYSGYELEDLLHSYEHSTKAPLRRASGVPAELPLLDPSNVLSPQPHRFKNKEDVPMRVVRGHSLYSEMTGEPRHTPEPREPVRDLVTSRFSMTTYDTSASSYSMRSRSPVANSETTSEAEAYATRIRPALAASSPLQPGISRTSSMTRTNPFQFGR